MKGQDVMLYLLVLFAALSAVGILVIRNVFHAALLLIASLVSVAGIYLLMQAEFLAVTQLIIYAGGVLVLIVFGIMLTQQLSGRRMVVLHQHYVSGCLVAGTLLAVLSYSINGLQPVAGVTLHNMDDAITRVGLLLFTEYVAPFEVAGVLLLISLIAAAVIASQILAKRNT